MSNASDLKDLLTTAAAEMGNAIEKADCLLEIDKLYAFDVALAATAGDVVSYSIAGRSVQHAPRENAERSRAVAWAKIQQYLYCRGVGLADVRSPV